MIRSIVPPNTFDECFVTGLKSVYMVNGVRNVAELPAFACTIDQRYDTGYVYVLEPRVRNVLFF